MAWRYFELVDGPFRKFWAITVRGSTQTVRYGRTGAAGRTQSKEFDSAAAARSSRDKLIRQKKSKGYREKNPAAKVKAADTRRTRRKKSPLVPARIRNRLNKFGVGHLSIHKAPQKSLVLAPTVPANWLVEVEESFPWKDSDEYHNRVYERYMYTLNYDLVKRSRIRREETLWAKLTRPQRVFRTFLAFDGEIHNGGMYQFSFNRPGYVVAALETLHELGATELAKDYQTALKELANRADQFVARFRQSADEALSQAQRWDVFAGGYDEFTAGKAIEEYYFKPKFSVALLKQVAEYVEENFALMAKTRGKSPKRG